MDPAKLGTQRAHDDSLSSGLHSRLVALLCCLSQIAVSLLHLGAFARAFRVLGIAPLALKDECNNTGMPLQGDAVVLPSIRGAASELFLCEILFRRKKTSRRRGAHQQSPRPTAPRLLHLFCSQTARLPRFYVSFWGALWLPESPSCSHWWRRSS